MISHRLNASEFRQDLISCDISNNSTLENVKAIFNEKDLEVVEYTKSPLSCGQAHAAMIQNGILYTWGKTRNGRYFFFIPFHLFIITFDTLYISQMLLFPLSYSRSVLDIPFSSNR